MDLLRFVPTVGLDASYLENGTLVEGWDSLIWTERYFGPGEFQLTCDVSSGLTNTLPPGTLLTHVDTLEVMIVETHEISETSDLEARATIKGRSLDSFLEQRVIDFGPTLAAGYIWNQIVTLFANIFPSAQSLLLWADPTVAIVDIFAQDCPGFQAYTSISSPTQPGIRGTPDSIFRKPDFGSAAETIKGLLALNDLGIRSVRKNSFGVRGSTTQTRFDIHCGTSKIDSVIFSWSGGDIVNAEYIRSNKLEKTLALAMGNWYQINAVSPTGGLGVTTGLGRRMVFVDAREVDKTLTGYVFGSARDDIWRTMSNMAKTAISQNTGINMSRVDISPSSRYKYRQDYDIGDLVRIEGNFGAINTARVTEYVEIEDATGESGYPTLSIIA